MRKAQWMLVLGAVAAVAAGALVLQRQGGPATRASLLEFEPRVLDLGTIPEGGTRSGSVRVRNRTPGPHVITVAAPSCGCTKATWPTEPIAGGGEGESVITMTPPGKAGAIEERTVTYLIDGDAREVVTVRATVGPPEAPPPAPASPTPAAPKVASAPAAPAPAAPVRARAPFVRTEPSVFPGARIRFPSLDTWVTGSPRDAFEPGKVYVFDFFETTCGHCKQYAPLIERLAREYGARGMEFIAITGEDAGKVRAWLAQRGAEGQPPYAVVSDADRSALATLQGGTFRSFNPRFFVARDGVLLWHGHPKEAEATLSAIAAGTWDPESVRQKFVTESVAARAKNYLDGVARECDGTGDWRPMFAALDAVRAAVPERAAQYDTQRFVIMIGLADMPDAGYELGRRVAAEHPQDMVTLRSLARGALQSPYAKRRDLDFGMEMAVAADRLAKGEDARAADTVALAWFSKGDRAQAVANGERAVRLEKDPKARAQYEQALSKYRTGTPGPEPTKARTAPGAKPAGARPASDAQPGGEQAADDQP
jgi:thiol-disulfide isomerase/thioredoxin